MKMMGLSTTYYAMQGFSIYESVCRIVDLGFDTVEFGAAHPFEENVWETLNKIKREFKETVFLVHNLFPPLETRIWFNPADGLTALNKTVVDNLLQVTAIVESPLLSIHPPILCEVTLGETVRGGFIKPVWGKPKPEIIVRENFWQFMEYINDKAKEDGIGIAIENMNTSFVNTFLSTADSFRNIFTRFVHSGLLLDVGHSLQCGDLNKMTKLDGYIREIHLHDIGVISETMQRAHFPIRSPTFFNPISHLLRDKTIYLIFEHGADVLTEEIIKEKTILQNYLNFI